jgi:hypothetical protein
LKGLGKQTDVEALVKFLVNNQPLPIITGQKAEDIKAALQGEADIREEGPVMIQVPADLELSVKDAEEKPYPNEHACRLMDPGKYDSFARKNCARKAGPNKACVDHIYGVKDGTTEIQALRFPEKDWEMKDAMDYCKAQGGKFEAAAPPKEFHDGENIPVVLEEQVGESISMQLIEGIKATMDTVSVDTKAALDRMEMLLKMAAKELEEIRSRIGNIESHLANQQRRAESLAPATKDSLDPLYETILGDLAPKTFTQRENDLLLDLNKQLRALSDKLK